MKVIKQDGLSCASCPYKKAEAQAGRPWGPEQERTYCHGGHDPATKGNRVGCAVAWRYWLGVDTYAEESYLQAEGKPAPTWWKRRHWIEFVRVKRALEALRLEDRKKELGDVS